MNLVFLGSGEFGRPTLERLAQRHTIRAVVTQPDRPAGRSKALTSTPIGAFAAEHLADVPLLKPENINAADPLAHIRSLDADAWVVIAYGQKLSRALLDGVFAINLHASLLPRWRGAAPINHAVLAGDAETGNSVITLADRMDAGLVLAQSRRAIDPLATAGELHDLLAQDGPELIEQVLAQHAANSLSPQTQDESLVTLASKLSRADAWIDFAHPADACRRRIHGLTPWPGVSVRLEPGDLTLKLLRAQSLDAHAEQTAGAAGGSSGDANPRRRPFSPGAIIDAGAGLVSCGQSTTLRLIEVQPAGKRPMSWQDFTRGRRIADGAILASEVSPP